MSSIEEQQTDDLARSLFDGAVVPLARARRDAGEGGYFALAPDPSAASYFVPVEESRPPVSEFPGGGHAAGLIDAVAAFWAEQGEPALADMAPALQEIAEALRAERGEASGDVDIYCYTMF